MPPSDLDLDAIRQRWAATTPGEWMEHDHWIYVGDQGLMLTRARVDVKEEAESLANRRFAAAAHQDVPALLARVAALEAAMRRMREQVMSTTWKAGA